MILSVLLVVEIFFFVPNLIITIPRHFNTNFPDWTKVLVHAQSFPVGCTGESWCAMHHRLLFQL